MTSGPADSKQLSRAADGSRAPRAIDETARVNAARAFAVLAARHAANTRCTNVIVLELGQISPVCDFFVIATGTSGRQMRTVADEIAELGQENDFRAIRATGYEGESWILLDCIDIVVHVFTPESRGYYDLDNLWGDAKKVDWEKESAASPKR